MSAASHVPRMRRPLHLNSAEILADSSADSSRFSAISKKKGFFNPSNPPYLPLHSFLRHPLLFLISFLLLAGDVASRDSPETGILAPDSFPAGLQDSWPHLNETNISTPLPPPPQGHIGHGQTDLIRILYRFLDGSPPSAAPAKCHRNRQVGHLLVLKTHAPFQLLSEPDQTDSQPIRNESHHPPLEFLIKASETFVARLSKPNDKRIH